MAHIVYDEKVEFQGSDYTLEAYEVNDEPMFALVSEDSPAIWFRLRQQEEEYLVFERLKGFQNTSEYYTLFISLRKMTRLYTRKY